MKLTIEIELDGLFSPDVADILSGLAETILQEGWTQAETLDIRRQGVIVGTYGVTETPSEDDAGEILCECGRLEHLCAIFHGASQHRDAS